MDKKYKLAVIGSRDFVNYELMKHILTPLVNKIELIISGGARGADKLAEQFASDNNIPLKIYKADWDTYGKSAGHRRNTDIINESDLVIAFWDGASKGTLDSITKARKSNKPMRIVKYDNVKK